jgi:hypothetical protein
MLPSEVRFVGFGSMEGTFPFKFWGASREVFFSVSLVDLGLGPVSTLVARTLPSFGMNRNNISII